ncbi:hypothetical protein ASPZODRAFT_129649 [Penicilliopsis zonata CBS 506.65]|uniref:Uncharacterized protein n=1 Tax=Penicilliopsis zonata CBS 506.65 TaxID=1073090 RepID=A0A1L9SQ85_9EURO|nr:hypothetical protein ASPZODRAFT_129649 [Penicilliopsis zonata CBS 506.65]OJJ49234.1 hypothetical protein ASPZODRAFT_129649 [Penicilliopsis zonata CBS 506.65]
MSNRGALHVLKDDPWSGAISPQPRQFRRAETTPPPCPEGVSSFHPKGKLLSTLCLFWISIALYPICLSLADLRTLEAGMTSLPTTDP